MLSCLEVLSVVSSVSRDVTMKERCFGCRRWPSTAQYYQLCLTDYQLIDIDSIIGCDKDKSKKYKNNNNNNSNDSDSVQMR